MDDLVHPRRKKGVRRAGAIVGEPVLAVPFWGMLYVDDAEVASQSPE